MNKFKLFLKYLFLFFLGGAIYYGVEIAYRGYSHFSMFIVGGSCFVFIGLINEKMPWDTWFELQVLYGLLYTLAIEFISGCILNIYLKLNIWDYSNLPLNILGQVCLPFALLWIPLIAIAIVLDDFIRYKIFKEEKPRYRSFIFEKIKKILHK